MPFWQRFKKPAALRLKEHAQRVEETAEELAKQLRSWIRNEAVQADVVSEKEHAADIVKREIRLNLAKSNTAPLPRDRILELIWHQDEIADLCQDSALLMALRRPNLGLELEDAFRALGELLIKAVHAYVLAISSFEDALLSGNLGAKATDIAAHIDLVNHLEHESDLVEREIVATVYRREDLPPFDRYHIVQVVLVLGNTVDQVENAASDLSLLMAAASR